MLRENGKCLALHHAPPARPRANIPATQRVARATWGASDTGRDRNHFSAQTYALMDAPTHAR
eukprot:8403560-Alexandrium_andersonii.AAC.1